MRATTDHGPDPVTQPVQQPVSEPEQVHPLDEEPTRAVEREPVPETTHRGRGLGANRHLGSVLLSVLAVLGAYGALDYGFYRAYSSAQDGLGDGALSDPTMIALGAAALCLLVAAAAGRISGLGPLVAGLALGVAPAVWVFLDFASY